MSKYSASFGRDFMNVGSGSKLGQQGSRSVLSGPSSKNLPSIFSIGNRAPPPPPPPLASQRRGDPNQANRILASFGLSSRDLDELSRYPEEKITPESLPQLIQQIKRRRSEDMSMLNYRERLPREPLRGSGGDWDDDVRSFRRDNFADRPSGLDHVVDYEHGSRSREPSYRERLDLDDRLRDRESFREDRFLSDVPFRKPSSDYASMGYGQQQERSVFEKTRGMPSIRNIDDFHGRLPKDFPHLCSLCDIPLHTKKGWSEHVNGLTHRRHRLLLLDVYPEWNGHGMGDSLMLQQSTNHAPGLLGPPPPAPKSLLSMGGGPEGRHGGPRAHLGMDERGPGPRRMQNRPMMNTGRHGEQMMNTGRHGEQMMNTGRHGTGRVVHIINFERGRNLKGQLLKLAEPFGEITNHLILNKMNEAFIEMSNAGDAMAVVDYYSTNPALIMGKPVRVHLSQKYKRIKKAEVKPDAKADTKKNEPGKVVHVSKLPSFGYTDSALITLAETFGKVKTYILMRVRNQAFIEMERLEDAQDMVKRCEIVPLVFQGKNLKVDLSERYKKLVLRIPNKLIEQKEKGRKRGHSPDRKAGAKEKQRKTETESGDGGQATTSEEVTIDDSIQTSEETDQKDIVTDSCEPELLEEDEEEEATLLETSSSVADDEFLDPNDADTHGEDQTEAQEPDDSASTANPSEGKPTGAGKFSGNIDDFVTLDEVGDEEAPGSKSKAAQFAEQNADTPLPAITTEYVLGTYQANSPVGVDFVVPKTGFYCKLCSLFYTNEEVAKVTHCGTLPHYQKLKKLFNKMAKNPDKKN